MLQQKVGRKNRRPRTVANKILTLAFRDILRRNCNYAKVDDASRLALERTLRMFGHGLIGKNKGSSEQIFQRGEQQVLALTNASEIAHADKKPVIASKYMETPLAVGDESCQKLILPDVTAYELKRSFTDSKFNVYKTMGEKNPEIDIVQRIRQHILRNPDMFKNVLKSFQANNTYSWSFPPVHCAKTSAKVSASLPEFYPQNKQEQEIVYTNDTRSCNIYNPRTVNKNSTTLDQQRKSPKRSIESNQFSDLKQLVSKNEDHTNVLESVNNKICYSAFSFNDTSIKEHMTIPKSDTCCNQIFSNTFGESISDIIPRAAKSSFIPKPSSGVYDSKKKARGLVILNQKIGQGDIDHLSSAEAFPSTNNPQEKTEQSHIVNQSPCELDKLMADIMTFMNSQNPPVIDDIYSLPDGNPPLAALMSLYTNISFDNTEQVDPPKQEYKKHGPINKPGIVPKHAARKNPSNLPIKAETAKGALVQFEGKDDVEKQKKLITSEFSSNFILYSKRKNELFSAKIITRGRSFFWLKRAGLFGNGLINESSANDLFAEIVGRKLLMNIQDYVKYLSKLSFESQLKVEDVIQRLGSCLPPGHIKKADKVATEKPTFPPTPDVNCASSKSFTCSMPNVFSSPVKCPKKHLFQQPTKRFQQ